LYFRELEGSYFRGTASYLRTLSITTPFYFSLCTVRDLKLHSHGGGKTAKTLEGKIPKRRLANNRTLQTAGLALIWRRLCLF